MFGASKKYTFGLSSFGVTQTALLALQQGGLGPPPTAGLDSYLREREGKFTEENYIPFSLFFFGLTV